MSDKHKTMMIKIKHITDEEFKRQFFMFRVFQHIDGDIVDGILRPGKLYAWQPGYKNYELR